MSRSHWLLFLCYLLFPVVLYVASVGLGIPTYVGMLWGYYCLLIASLSGCGRLPGGGSVYRWTAQVVALHLVLWQVFLFVSWKGISMDLEERLRLDILGQFLALSIFVIFFLCCWAASRVADHSGRRLEAGLHFLVPALMVGGVLIHSSTLLLFFVQGFRAAWLSEQILAQPEAEGTGISPVG